MNEDLEITRADVTKRTLKALTEIVENQDKSFNERLACAEMVRSISQDLILSDLSSRGLDQDGSFKKKLLDQAKNLDHRDEP